MFLNRKIFKPRLGLFFQQTILKQKYHKCLTSETQLATQCVPLMHYFTFGANNKHCFHVWFCVLQLHLQMQFYFKRKTTKYLQNVWDIFQSSLLYVIFVFRSTIFCIQECHFPILELLLLYNQQENDWMLSKFISLPKKVQPHILYFWKYKLFYLRVD